LNLRPHEVVTQERLGIFRVKDRWNGSRSTEICVPPGSPQAREATVPQQRRSSSVQGGRFVLAEGTLLTEGANVRTFWREEGTTSGFGDSMHST